MLRRNAYSFETHGPSPVMFAKVCIFEAEPTTVTLHAESIYKVSIESGINSIQLQRHTCLLDIGAGLDLINNASLKKEWQTDIKRQQFPGLRTATKEPIILDGTILLIVKIGELKVRIRSENVENVVVNTLLGASFIDRYIRGIFLSKIKVLP